MRTVEDVYTNYRIPTILRLHQLRVAAVGTMICEHFHKANIKTVKEACLFHDMGNIIKFDLSDDGPLLSLFKPEEIETMKEVRRDFIKTYGADEHEATSRIAAEIGLSSESRMIIDRISFANLHRILDETLYELWVAQYADMRVGPRGIVSIEERISDLKERYALRPDMFGTPDQVERNENALRELESRLLSEACLMPSDISDESIANSIEALARYER